MLRYGRKPKAAILFRTDKPFKKVKLELVAPDGSTDQKLEFLGDGQQVVVHGVHPDTREMYQWVDGDPGKVSRDKLPLIDEAEAKALIAELADIAETFGYQVVETPKKRKAKSRANCSDDTRTNWGHHLEAIRAGHALHDNLRDLAAKLIASGMDAGAVVNLLRDATEGSEAVHDERWRDRYDDIPRLVDGAERLVRRGRQIGAGKTVQSEDAPAAQPANGAVVLDAVRAYLKRFVSYPSEHALVAHTLWCAHTHMLEAFDTTARLAFLSAEPESGKTRGLEASEPLCSRAIFTVNSSSNYLYRRAADEAGPPTVLFDEIDCIFGPKAKEHEDIRGFINSGHRKGATFGRCRAHGSVVVTEDAPCYAAVAMAGLGWLPDTLLSRSVIIRMRRRLKTEKVEPFRTRTSIPEGKAIGAQLAAWAKSVFDAAVAHGPKVAMPEGVEDRQGDAWETLLVVADLAGGEWPQLAREAAVHLVRVSRETPVSLSLRLLGDMRAVFFKRLAAVAVATPKGLPTRIIVDELFSLEDTPWQTINKGDGLTSNQIANYVRDYGVNPNHLRPDPDDAKNKPRGYLLRELADAWRRYLPPLSLSLNDVPDVPAVPSEDDPRTVLDQYFEWATVSPEDAGTSGTSGTPNSGGERGEELDPTRVSQLAKWWRRRKAELLDELSPAQVETQLRNDLHDTLANMDIPDSAIDTEIGRVVREAARARRT
jgi:hypothetical protein